MFAIIKLLNVNNRDREASATCTQSYLHPLFKIQITPSYQTPGTAQRVEVLFISYLMT